MEKINKEPEMVLNVLATDLDGTLIPLPDSEDNLSALTEVHARRQDTAFTFIYATGRHFESVQEAITSHNLPLPDWIICDVGTSIYIKENETFIPFPDYVNHLQSLIGDADREQVMQTLQDIPGLELQCEAHQQEFKISYQCETDRMESLIEEIKSRISRNGFPFDVTGSVDPFLHCGLIDLLPSGTSKAYALEWLSTHADFSPESVIYAGDSGNDFSALTCGFRAIVVKNAGETLSRSIMEELKSKKMSDRGFFASRTATSGVVEGCKHFGLW